jgi:effector-binding domain-containing protein
MTGYAIEARALPGQATAVRRARLTAGDLPGWLADTYAQVETYLRSTGTAMVGPPFARYVFHNGAVDVEAGFPVVRPVAGDDGVQPSRLPPVVAAVTTHHGRYEAVEDAYRAIIAWLTDRGWEPTGGHWEVYFGDPAREPDPARWRTDLVVPYRTAGG